jgi:hypothetical protein
LQSWWRRLNQLVSTVALQLDTALYTKQKAAGGRIAIKPLAGADHNDLVLSLSTLFRGRYPVVAESVAFLNAH